MIGPLLAVALAAHPAADTAVARSYEAPERHPVIGLGLDAGVPSGAGATLLVQPLSWLRLHAGPGTNGAGFGIRGGATFLPARWFVRPTFTLEGGHFFEGDANKVAQNFANLPDFGEEMLRTFSYDFGSAQVGVEVGSHDGFFAYLRAGYSYLDARLGSFESKLDDGGDAVSVSADGPTMSSPIPSATLGVAFFL